MNLGRNLKAQKQRSPRLRRLRGLTGSGPARAGGGETPKLRQAKYPLSRIPESSPHKQARTETVRTPGVTGLGQSALYGRIPMPRDRKVRVQFPRAADWSHHEVRDVRYPIRSIVNPRKGLDLPPTLE